MRDQIESAESKFGYDSIQKYAEVSGPLAIPILRQVATLPADNYCAYLVNDARMTLAKLGDEAAYRVIKEAWLKEKPSPYPGYSARILAIGDDWALFALVGYLIQHANDPALQTEFGPADGPYDGRDGLLEAIRDIARLRRISDLPNAATVCSTVAAALFRMSVAAPSVQNRPTDGARNVHLGTHISRAPSGKNLAPMLGKS